MKIYDISFNQLTCSNISLNNSNNCIESSIVSTVSNQASTMITNIGLTFPGSVRPLKPIIPNECNSLVGFNSLGLSEINPCFGYACSHTLKICGDVRICKDLTVCGHTQLHDLSVNNLEVSGNLIVHGHSQLEDVSTNNLEVSGNLIVHGHSQLEDVSTNNLEVSGNLLVLGHTKVCDLSACNVDISQNLEVFGHTQLVDVSCATLQCDASSTVINGQSIVNNHPADNWQPITSPPMASNFGMYITAKNLYIDVINADANRGMIVSLSQDNSGSFFRVIKTFPSFPYLFEVGGDGITQTQDIFPYSDISYNLGSLTKRWLNMYAEHYFVTDISAINISVTNLTVTGIADLQGHTTFVDASGINLTLSNDLNVAGIMTSETWLVFADASGGKLRLSLGLEVDGTTTLEGHLAFIDASGEQLQLKEDLTMYYGTDFGNQLTLRSFPQASPGNYRVLDLSSGLAYFANNWAVNGGAASDNVGVVSIAHTNLHDALNQNVLQLSSAIVDGSYNSSMSILKCKNTSISDVLFNIDVGGRITAQTDRTRDSFIFKNTITTGASPSFVDSIIFLDSARGRLAPYSYSGADTLGYSFLKCQKNGGIGGTEVLCQIDGDGSIKAKTSITISDISSEWPPVPGAYSRNITLIPGQQSYITTRYSEYTSVPSGNPLRLQSDGQASNMPFTYTNMVEIIPNEGETVLGFKFNNDASENILWWTNNSNISQSESLYMITRPAFAISSVQDHPIFEFLSGGTLGTDSSGVANIPYFLRYHPEAINSSGVTSNTIIIIGDDRNLATQIGGGKVGTTGTTPSTQGWIETNKVDCNIIDVTNINSGSNAVDLNIGTGFTQNIQMDMGDSGQIDMGSGSDIICSAGSVRICAANHDSIIGTFGLLPSSGTGFRGFSSTTTVGIIGGLAAKLSVLKNVDASGGPQFLTLSAIEGPQATILMRGQVQLQGYVGIINVDSCAMVFGMSFPFPHTIPFEPDPFGRGMPLGTFTKMFRYDEATVMVTNAGDPLGAPGSTRPHDMLFTRVAGNLTFSGSSTSETLLHIDSDPSGTPNIWVNYTIMVERNEPPTGGVPGTGYANNPFTEPKPLGSTEYYWNPSRTPAAMNEITGSNTWDENGPITPP